MTNYQLDDETVKGWLERAAEHDRQMEAEQEFWRQTIALLLGLIDAIERWQNTEPRTKELRDAGKAMLRGMR